MKSTLSRAAQRNSLPTSVYYKLRAGLITSVVIISFSDSQPTRAELPFGCHEAAISKASSINLITFKYTSRSVEGRDSSLASALDLNKMAQQLNLLIKTDTLLTTGYDGLAVTGSIEEIDQACSPESLLNSLVKPEKNLVSPGQALLMLYGRIYQEGQDIFLQSYLRRVRFPDDAVKPAPDLLKLTLKDADGQSVVFSSSIPGDVIVFPPRRILVSQLEQIAELASQAARLYSQRDAAASSVPLSIDREDASTYIVSEVDPSGWHKILSSPDKVNGWIKSDVYSDGLLHQLMPELDFISGEVGYLLTRQSYDAKTFQIREPRSYLTSAMHSAFERYRAREGENERPEVRAAGLSMEGATVALDADASGDAVWRKAGDIFHEALKADPSNSMVGNLVAIAGIVGCCQEQRDKTKIETVENRFFNVLSLQPADADALANLENLYRYSLSWHANSSLVAELQNRETQISAVRVALGYSDVGFVAANPLILASVPSLTSPYFAQMMNGFKTEAKKRGVTVIEGDDGEFSPAKQTADVEQALRKGINGIILSPSDAEALAPALQEAIDAKIAVITVGRRVPSVKGILNHIGSDDVTGGEEQGNLITKMFPDGATILNLQGERGNIIASDRNDGLHRVLDKAGEKYKIVFEQSAGFQRDKAFSVAEEALGKIQTPPQVIVAANDEMAMGALKAVRAHNLKDISIIGFNAAPEALGEIRDGNIAATIEQFPGRQSALGVDIIADFITRGKKPEREITLVEPLVITKDNLKESELFNEMK